MICKFCERNLKTISYLNRETDKLSYRIQLLEDLLKKSQENERFAMADREKFKKELMELKERIA